MNIRYSEVISVLLVSITVAFCTEYGDTDGANSNDQNKIPGANQPNNMAKDFVLNKQAEDVASFKELIGEARQIFKESEKSCHNHRDESNRGPHHLKLLGAVSASKQVKIEGTSNIILLGDIFDVRDVMPDHQNFTDKLSWVQLVSENYRMDLLLTAKDRPFQINANDRFAVTIREDPRFNHGTSAVFKPGSFDSVMNGTLYKLLISDSTVHPTKTQDILYVTFGDSFLKLRSSENQCKYFQNCKQLYILFQKLAFK